MSLETESSSETAAESTPSEATTTSGSSGYSVVDPGYETVEPTEDDLAALKAENTKSKPSGESKDDSAGDASEAESDDGEAEETAEAPAGDGADAQAADSEITDELLDRAIAVGYELEDIRDFTDAKALEKEISRVERLQQRLQAKKAGPETATGADAEPESKEPDWDQMIEDGHDPDIIALQKSNWQRAAAAEAMVRQLQQAEQLRAAAAEADRFDDVLNGLGEEYEPILGKGRRAALTKSAPEAAANRQKVFTKMAVLRRGYELAGEPVPPEAELIHEAVQASFYKQAQEIARNSIKKQIKKAGSQALSRPRSGSMQELSGPDRALKKEQEFWKAHS